MKRNITLALASLLLCLALAPDAGAQNDLEVTPEDLYYEARGQLRDGEYLAAADGFGEVAENHRDDSLAPKALYWRAFALSREGDRWNLREAKNTLELLFERYPEEARRGDIADLAVEIQGELARLGDADAAAEIAELADAIQAHGASRDGDRDRETSSTDETRLAALNALIHMDSDRAAPILTKILVEAPDRYSEEFREKAVFLLSQNGGPDALDTFLHVIRNDDSADVREQAVFWLGQSGDRRATGLLAEIARDSSEDDEIRDKAIFSLSQMGGREANEILRDIALDSNSSVELRAQTVFWIGQSDDRNAMDFLEQLYRETDEPEIKDKAIFSISQIGGRRSFEFLDSIVRDGRESTEARKQALFWMSQSDASLDADVIVDLFNEVDDVELREQAIFALSQIDTDDAVDALIRIAKSADDGELRERAIFWLGQSNSERAVDYLTELIEEDF